MKALALALLSLFALCLLAPDAARAGSPQAPALPEAASPSPEPVPPSDWEFRALLYGWISAIDARVSARGFEVDPSASFLDLLKNLNWAIEAAGEVRYQRALLILDLIGNQLEIGQSSNSLTRPFQLDPPDGPVGDLTVGPAQADVRTTIWILDVKPGWRVLSLPVADLVGSKSPEDPRRIDLDVFTGIRYWNVENTIHAQVAPGSLTIGGNTIGLGGLDIPDIDLGEITVPGSLLSGTSRRIHQRFQWVDWILASRIRGDITEHVSSFLMGDVGGFGINSSSSPTWQAAAGLQWAFAEHFSFVLAYRALGVDRKNALESAILHGPLIGLGLRF
jgi:hypothetical protein